MSDTYKGDDGPKLSAALRRAIAADSIGCFVENAVLKGADLEALKRIVADDPEEVSGTVINRKRALGALARSDPSLETGRLLTGVLADRERPLRERAVAAAYLGLLPPEAAEGPLLSALPDAAGPLQVEVIKALGQAGSKTALAELRKLDLPQHDPARRQLALSRVAIAFRERADGTDSEALDRELELRSVTIEAKPLSAKAVRETQGAIGGSTFGIALNPEVGFAFDCGTTQNALFLNKNLKRGSYVKGVTRQPMIAGVIVSQAEALQYFTLRWLLFTSPGKEGVRMVLVRPNGEPAFEGLAGQGEKGLGFKLRDIGAERTAAAIEGEITDDTVRWSMRVFQGQIRGKLRPRAITGAERVGPRAHDPEPAAGTRGRA